MVLFDRVKKLVDEAYIGLKWKQKNGLCPRTTNYKQGVDCMRKRDWTWVSPKVRYNYPSSFSAWLDNNPAPARTGKAKTDCVKMIGSGGWIAIPCTNKQKCVCKKGKLV